MPFGASGHKLGYMIKWLLRDKKAMSVEEAKRMIDAFSEPRNDYDRCYQHYQCVFHNRGKLGRIFLNCAGLLAIPFFLVLYAFNRLVLRFSEFHDAILICYNNKYGMSYDYSGLVPHELKAEFPGLWEIRQKAYPPLRKGALGMKALKVWLGMVIRHPLAGYCNFNTLAHIMFFNRLLILYRPKALIVARLEANYVSSILTMFCELRGCELILLMHGELGVSKNTAFVRFSRMYIWDEHYRYIMLWGRSDAIRYIVAKPDSLSLFHGPAPGGPYLYDLCYYMTGSLDGDYQENLEAIKDALVTLSEHGLRVKVRPHPRWSDSRALQTLFDRFPIEWASEKPLPDSIAETHWILGSFSTVLLQAFYAGKTVVLDDVSNPEYFSKLKEMQYIMLGKPHLLLSELLHNAA